MLTDLIRDVLLPKTDLMVGVQAVILLALVSFGVWRTWHIPELRLLVLALGIFVLGLMVLRASH